MEATRTFTHEEYVDGRFHRLEVTDVSLIIDGEYAEIHFDYEEELIQEERREAVSLSIESIDIPELERLCEALGRWCGDESNGSLVHDTGYLEGICTSDGQDRAIERLGIEVHQQRLRINALNGPNTIGTVTIPPRQRTEESGAGQPIHIYSFSSFLHSALSCAGHFGDDLSPRLDAAGEFTGPLREDLHEVCVRHYSDGNHAEAILNAGQQLERNLKDHLDDYRDDSASDLMGRVFNSTDPVLRLSTDADEQLGIQFLFQGAIKALRNPLTHNNPRPETGRFPDRITRRHARDALYFFDLLYLIIEEGERTDQ